MIEMHSTAFSARGHTRSARMVLFAALAFALTVALSVAPARAKPLNPYKVTGVGVDATEKSAQTAKRKALAEGWRKATAILLRRITLSRDHAKLPQVSDEDLPALKEGFEIDWEKTTRTSYRGEVTYRFRAAAVGRLLKEAEITYIETPSKPVLVLAIYQTGAAQYLWDEPNPWRRAWSKLDWRNGLVEFARPRADLTDLRTIDAAQAVAADKVALANIARAYGAGEVLISIARMDGQVLNIEVRRFNVLAQTIKPFKKYSVSDPKEEVLVRAARVIASAYENAWKQSNLVVSGAEATITATAPLINLPYWIKLRNAIRSVRALRAHRVVSLTRQQAKIQLTYVGQPEQLQTALQQSDLVLTKLGTDANGGDVWMLKIAGANVPEPKTAPEPTGTKEPAGRKPSAAE